MLTRIELKNFMSHRHTVLEPAAGLTVLVGPNNCGKSALVAALQILCHNENSTYVMRHGERECSVEVQTSDGHTVRWTRKNSPSYLIDGEAFDRLQRSGLPEPLHRALRLPKVDAGDDTSFDIHFGYQKSPIFLLDRPAAAAAKFFASSSDAIRLVEMQRRHREKQADKQREKLRLEGEAKEVNAQLDALQPAAAIDQQVKAAEAAHHELMQLAAALVHMEAESSRLEGQATTVAYHRAQGDAVVSLVPPPLLAPVEKVEELIGQIRVGLREFSLAGACSEALGVLSVPPVLADPAVLEGIVEGLQCRLGELVVGEGQRRVLSPLAAPPALCATEELQLLMDGLVSGEGALAREASCGEVLQSLAAPVAPTDVSELIRCLENLHTAAAAFEKETIYLGALSELEAPLPPLVVEPLKQLCEGLRENFELAGAFERQAQVIEAERIEVAEKVREVAAGKACPTCGAALEPERLLAHVAAHGVETHG